RRRRTSSNSDRYAALRRSVLMLARFGEAPRTGVADLNGDTRMSARIPLTLVLLAASWAAWQLTDPLAAAPTARTPAARPARDPLPVAAAIDRAIDRKLAEAKLPASPLCD